MFKFLRKYTKKLKKILYAVIITLALIIPLFSINLPRADFKKFPLKEVEFLKINDIKGNIIVPFGFGSYVSYKLYPNNLIYMDGRYEEVYNELEFQLLKHYELVLPAWDSVIKNYDTEILMPLKVIDVYPVLLKHPDWELIYEGDLCGIFVKKGSIHTKLLAPSDDILYYRNNMFKGSFGNYLKYKDTKHG